MSWDSIESRDFLGGVPAHQLSATRLLSSPDPSRHHLEEPQGKLQLILRNREKRLIT
ncbi:hypothetical protein B5X24_HaOG205932 [Helicoverpa armigera]|uniref:Uncharacterized protein n=1 Tax=Helicoverpa armigera TaxID=29058 RepID=A0A2W1BUZ1_HELAM|nr:hypothetical protein B5X24_HaOG205932 [Helicoverpa armigera]